MDSLKALFMANSQQGRCLSQSFKVGDAKALNISSGETWFVALFLTPATQSMLSFMRQKDTCAFALFVARALGFMGVADI